MSIKGEMFGSRRVLSNLPAPVGGGYRGGDRDGRSGGFRGNRY